MPSLPAPGESRALIEQEISFANWETLCAGELAFSPEVWYLPSPKVSSLSFTPPPGGGGPEGGVGPEPQGSEVGEAEGSPR